MKACWIGLAVFGLALVAGVGAARPAQSVVAFCQAHPNLDRPDPVFYGAKRRPGRLPQEVAAAGASNWRCMDGQVYVCNGGASGSACQKMFASREPHAAIREFCSDNPDADFVAMAVIGNSSSTWHCRGERAEIRTTVPLDKRGFMAETWKPLTDANGAVQRVINLPADPR